MSCHLWVTMMYESALLSSVRVSSRGKSFTLRR